MTGQELDEIVRELYVLPPTDFVAARNELVREAKAAGSREIAERLQHLRRPTRSAWLVNLLASDSRAMQRLSNLGRQLRDAQTELAHAELRSLAEQRRLLIADLLDQAQTYADEAGVRLSPTVLSEVEATLQAALVDLAGALTIRNGRLVRPLSHAGFGPRPRAHVLQVTSTIELRGRRAGTAPGRGRAGSTATQDVRPERRRVVREHRSSGPATSGKPSSLRQAEEELAAAEASHWQAEFELADAEGAVEAAVDRLSSLDTQRIEARRDRVTAQRYLADARSRQRDAVNALAEARRRLDAARDSASSDE